MSWGIAVPPMCDKRRVSTPKSFPHRGFLNLRFRLNGSDVVTVVVPGCASQGEYSMHSNLVGGWYRYLS